MGLRHENPAFCQKEIDWVNDARNIARNDHVVSINNAMEIDLTGQVNAESIGPRSTPAPADSWSGW